MTRAHRALRSLLQGRLSFAALYTPVGNDTGKVSFSTGVVAQDYKISYPACTLLTAEESRKVFKAANPLQPLGFVLTKDRVAIIADLTITVSDALVILGERYEVVEIDSTSYTGYSVCKIKYLKGASSLHAPQLAALKATGWKGSPRTEAYLDELCRSVTEVIGDDWEDLYLWPMAGDTQFDSLHRLNPAGNEVATFPDYRENGSGSGYPLLDQITDVRVLSAIQHFNLLMGRS